MLNNSYYYIFENFNLIPMHILVEEDTFCINCSEGYGKYLYRKRETDLFIEGYEDGFEEGFENPIIVLVNPADELRTYLKLLGVKCFNSDKYKIPVAAIHTDKVNTIRVLSIP